MPFEMRIAMNIVAAALLTSAGPTLAEVFSIQPPIACDLGTDCFIQQYVDHDLGPGARDFTCGPLSYDGHKGTDFGLPSFATMHAGVDVLAAAPGTVVAMRDGMPDTGSDGTPPEQLQNKDCGNGVVIRHAGGYQTQYCHMKQGSVIAKKGQRVLAGDVLGEVGFSGRTQFPHVHISVRRHGNVVDPFAPDSLDTCGDAQTGLWADPLQYTPGGFLSAGFADAVPEYTAIKDGSAARATLSKNAPALVVWAFAFGGRDGDLIHLSITGPDGPFSSSTATIKGNKAQFFRAAGKKIRRGIRSGTYQGKIVIERDGKEIDSITTSVAVE